MLTPIESIVQCRGCGKDTAQCNYLKRRNVWICEECLATGIKSKTISVVGLGFNNNFYYNEFEFNVYIKSNLGNKNWAKEGF